MILVLHLEGPLPSKKNRWRHGPRGIYLPGKEQVAIDAILYQVIRFRNAERLLKPMEGKLAVHLMVPKGRADLDNQLSTMLDILQKACIIKNDRDVCEIGASFSAEKEIKVTISHLKKL